ncbi:hypothetical protein [Alistipes putredinis]|uniref:hypothetical protein n=1 Tax=Alistipes putredinis TaxID=28117 RepID=UPI003A888497
MKFLFLLLCGSVLTTAGCKDYDDDIDALRNDVEDLKGTVVELNGFENRIAALEQTQAAFEAIDFSGFAKKGDISSLQTQIEGCVKDSDLAAKVVAAIESSLADGALQESLNSLKSGILEEIAGIYATQETLESVQETLENMIELKKDAAGFSLEVTQLIESYLSDNGFEAAGGELTDSQVSQIETAASQWIADAIKAELETAGSSINKWLGDELAVYMDQMTLGDNLLGQVSTQAIASVMEELDKEASALTEKIQGLIRENNGSLVISKDQLDQEFQNYLATLEANVGLLGSRIQSIVYLPDYVDGLIYFGNGEQYIVLSRENEVTHETEYRNLYLRPSAEGEQIATLRFRMTPARAVKKYANTEAMSLITEEVGTRAAAGFTIEEIKDIDETTGEFTVVATTDYDYVSAEKAGKTQMVALHVDGSALSEGESNDFETDFTSAFIGTAYAKAGIQIPATNFVLARADAENEGEYVEYTDEVTTEVKYTDKEVHGVLAGYTVMYKDGETILPLAEAAEANNWTVDLAALVSASAEFTFSDSGSEELYAVDGKALTFAVAESETALIGQTVTAAATYALLDEEGFSLEVKAGAVNKFSIAPDGVELSTPKSEVMWTYAAATSDDTYEAKGLVLTPDKGMLSAVQYNALKDNENLVVELYRGTELVSEIVPSIELPATPTYDTDVQTVDLKLVGDLAQSAEYVVKAVYTNDDKTVVTITIPVSVTGIPEIPMLEQTLELPYNAASSTGHHVAVEEFRALLWESLDQTARAQFGEETFMQLSWTSDMAKDEAGNYATTVGASGKNINFVFGKAAALNVSYTVKNLFTTADPVLTFEAVLHVTVTAPEIELLRGSSLSDDDRAQAVMKIEGSTLQIDAFDLSKTWYIAKDAPAEAKVVYATQAEGAVITDATLDWGTCDELSIVVTAQVMYGGKALGEPKTFTVSIADPIADATIAVEPGKLVAKVDEDVTLDVATLLTLKAVNDVNVFDGSTNAQNTNTAVAATIEYGEAVVSIPDGRVKFDAESHVLTVVEGGDLELMKEITVTIPVKYVYTFGERTAQIVVNVTK